MRILKDSTRAKLDEFTNAAIVCGALLGLLLLLKGLIMFKKLTGGLQSKTTMAGMGAALVLVGNGLSAAGDGGEVNWTSIIVGAALALLGALAGDHKPEPKGPDYRGL